MRAILQVKQRRSKLTITDCWPLLCRIKYAPKRVHQRSGVLMDADVRLRAAAALASNPAIERGAASHEFLCL